MLTRGRSLVLRAAAFLRAVRPWYLLVPLCAVQVLVAVVFALKTPHNGWLWYSGGDATEYWSGEWAIGHGWLPPTYVGWGLPVLYAWVPAVTGATMFVQAAWVFVVMQVAVLVPAVVVLVWLLADRMYGRLFAWWATALWIAAPLLFDLAIQNPGYRTAFEQHVLAPHAYGLTNMADLPSLAAVLAAAWLLLRAVDTGERDDALLAGLVAGVAIGVKPSNGFFLAAAVVLLLLERRPYVTLWAAAGFVPAIVTLALWKERGLGHMPLFSLGPHHVVAAASTPVLGFGSSYVDIHPVHFRHELHDLHEVFWSVRLVEWLAIGGAVGAIRRRPVCGIFLTVWCFAYLVVKGSSHVSGTVNLTYYRLVEPGFPAYVLLGACIVFLVPGFRATRAAPRTVAAPRALVAAAGVVLGLVPVLVVAAVRVPHAPNVAQDAHATNAPITGALTATYSNGRLSWPRLDGGGTTLNYVVYRDPVGDGCDVASPGTPYCKLVATAVTTTRSTSVHVTEKGAYRIAASADSTDDTYGDMMLLGPPVRVP